MFSRRTALGFLAAVPLALLARTAAARTPEIYSSDGVALRGYDPVAYFRLGSPVPGIPQHVLIWRGAVWQFSSAHTLSAFEMNPDAFAPQFGGYCALALANGHLAPSDPAAWQIYQGRLYLNHSAAVLSEWATDIDGNLTRAAAYWPHLLNS